MTIPRRSALRLCGIALLTATLTLLAPPAQAGEPVTVFAAASLTTVFETIGESHRQATGEPLRFSFASSSTLAKQIAAGAPAQMFASANERWMDHIEQLGLIAPGTRVSPIGNRLVLITPADGPLQAVRIGEDTDLSALLAPAERIAVGDPDHVPAGIYARQALETLGLWESVADRLARTSDVRAALALVETGEAPLGIVYATDAAVSDGVRIIGRFPEDSHTPITYPLAIIAGQDTPGVRAVYEALTGPGARVAYEAAGFTVR